MRRLGCLALIVAMLLGAGAAWSAWEWAGRGPLAQATVIDLPEGTSIGGAAARLERAGAIASATRFRLFARLLGAHRAIKAGDYRIPAHMSGARILAMLQDGRTVQQLLTIPEGLPSVLVRERLAAMTELSGAIETPPEGSVLPDSYAVGPGDSRAAVLVRMQRAMTGYLAAAWARRQPNIAVKSPREALILASIVEKETGKPDERRLVAALYSNRLRRGMPLQADPTTIYPVTHGKPLGRRILRSELRAKNGYNTYAISGLPAGPICNPGRASIDAVLNPADSAALYMVADGSGGHAFADTIDQHNANVAKWRAFRAAHGI